MVGLGKIFGRSVKNFGGPGQFLKVWKKIRNVREIRGSKIFGNEGEGRFREILSCPPPPKMRVAPQMPPHIPRPGAATACSKSVRFLAVCLSGTISILKYDLTYHKTFI